MIDHVQHYTALHAAEEKLREMGAEMERWRKLNVDATTIELRGRINSIQKYDEEVQLMINAHPQLQEAWDNFRVQYQLTVSKPLLETAYEKISGKKEGICHGCKREFKVLK